jgi:hypothetical protein
MFDAPSQGCFGAIEVTRKHMGGELMKRSIFAIVSSVLLASQCYADSYSRVTTVKYLTVGR